jgi:hypothetical protein
MIERMATSMFGDMPVSKAQGAAGSAQGGGQ